MNEAAASLNFYAHTAKGWKIQITIRDDDEEKLLARFGLLVKKLEEMKVTPEGKQRNEPIPQPLDDAPEVPKEFPPADAPKVVPAPNMPNPEQYFYVERIEPGTYDGKQMWKVKGGAFRKYGIPLYEEGLKTSGIDPMNYDRNILEPDPGFDAYYVDYTGKDNKIHHKVTRLVKKI